jgi:hypothetical protein
VITFEERGYRKNLGRRHDTLATAAVYANLKNDLPRSVTRPQNGSKQFQLDPEFRRPILIALKFSPFDRQTS